MASGALSELRVLECGDFVAAPFAAALFGHLGADVVKIEPPEGDSNRRRGPFPGGEPNLETSGLHLFLDQTKRSVVLQLDTDQGQADLHRLARDADVLIASGPADLLERRRLTYEVLKDSNPRLVVTSISPFGLQSSRRDAPMRELLDVASSGWLSMSPGALTEPELPPLKPFGQQAHFQAGLHAAVASLGGIAVCDRSGFGQQIDVSVQAVVASQLESGLMHFTYSGLVASRLGLRILGPWGVVELADGLLFLVAVTEEEWQRLLEYLGNPEWAASPLFADRLVRAENNDALLALIEAELAGRGTRETYHEMQARRIACTPVNEMADLLSNEHLAAREALVRLDHPDAGAWIYPGAPWKFSATPWQPGRPAPRLGEHTAEVLGDRGQGTGGRGREVRLPPQSSVLGPPVDVSPLAGVRVADFTWVWAGPVSTMQLAHLGADVIRIESAGRLDTVRGIPPFWQGERGLNRSGYYNQYNQGKRSLALNLKHPRALELAYEIVHRSDVVADNFSAGVMDRMGLGYEKLRSIKPDIIQISLAGHGQTGPISRYVAYGPVQVPMIGLAGLTGYPGGGPREVGISYGDPNGGMHAAFAILAALYHRRRSGEGQYIDMSQWEAALPLVVEGLLSYQMTGEQPPRQGNRDQFEAPQGLFRCDGDDAWVAISCWSDEEWRALAQTIGRLDLRDDPTLAEAPGRKAREPELEAAISAWTASRPPDGATAELQAAGVPAAMVNTTADIAADPDLAARHFWVDLDHPEGGGRRHAGIPWRFFGTPLHVRRRAPMLGEHTDVVLQEILGLSDSEIAALHQEGALQ